MIDAKLPLLCPINGQTHSPLLCQNAHRQKTGCEGEGMLGIILVSVAALCVTCEVVGAYLYEAERECA